MAGSMIAVLIIAAAGLSGCVSTITPPADPVEPCRIFLLEDARHTGLLLPDLEEGFVEYGYGDWDWYALQKDSWYHVFDTVLWPTRGCLGRRKLDAAGVARWERSGRLHPIIVSEPLVHGLLAELNARFDREAATMVFNPAYKLDFVHDDRGFWFCHNCHDATAEWLKRLGCDVSWTPVRFGLEVRRP